MPAVAATVQTTVTANIGVQQYTGKFSFQNPYLMLDDKRRSIFFENWGSSTELGVQLACRSAIAGSKIGFEAGAEPYAWNHGREGGGSKSYRIDASQWQLGFGYKFRSYTWNQPIPTANDTHIGQIHDEYKSANHMSTRGSTARIVPWRLLWAQLHQVYPDLNPLADNAGHLSYGHGYGISNYMYTLYSGRCPLGVKPSPMTDRWQAQKIGYETAWRVGRCQMRAPGFKVMPSSVNAHTVTPTTAETMSVQFILPPEKPVTVQVSVSNAAAIVNPKYLTFTPSNYDTAQFVHVQGLPGGSASEPFAVQFDTVSEDLVYHELNDSWSYSTERSSVEAVTVTVIEQADRSLTIPNRNATMIPLNVSGSVPSNTTFSHPLHGTISWFGENVIYTPAVDFVGTDSFSFAVNQGGTITRGHVIIT
ncbi:Ig-like domain-containing protein, partial [Rubritalea profundi]|uniref:Ig-like domain-containing protein n=1 Tax=Rubritalea profundi TaxID=1658618 RepID=UPI0013FE46CF